MEIHRRHTMAAFALAGALSLAPGGAGATILVVDDDGNECTGATEQCTSGAVRAAQPGDEIDVCPGFYAEQVVITSRWSRSVSRVAPGTR